MPRELDQRIDGARRVVGRRAAHGLGLGAERSARDDLGRAGGEHPPSVDGERDVGRPARADRPLRDVLGGGAFPVQRERPAHVEVERVLVARDDAVDADQRTGRGGEPAYGGRVVEGGDVVAHDVRDRTGAGDLFLLSREPELGAAAGRVHTAARAVRREHQGRERGAVVQQRHVRSRCARAEDERRHADGHVPAARQLRRRRRDLAVGDEDVHLRLLRRIVEALKERDAVHVLHRLQRVRDEVGAARAEAQVDTVAHQTAHLLLDARFDPRRHRQVARRRQLDDAAVDQDPLRRQRRGRDRVLQLQVRSLEMRAGRSARCPPSCTRPRGR